MGNPLARLVAWAAHEVITEYRRLDAPPPQPPPAPAPARTEINNVAATTQIGFTGYQSRPADARAEDTDG